MLEITDVIIKAVGAPNGIIKAMGTKDSIAMILCTSSA